MECTIHTRSPEETERLGKLVGQRLKGGDIVCLKGDLGAGKTAFAKGIGLGLGVEEPMTSPTFTMIQEYQINCQDRSLCLVHMDLYRLRQPEEAEVIGVEDKFEPGNISLIEWPEIAAYLLPHDHLEVVIEGSGDAERTFRFKASVGDWEKRLKDVFEQFGGN